MSGGALRMKRSRPSSTTARSSSWPRTGTKSGMGSIGRTRYAPIPARMSFCCAGTRPARSSAHTRRMYVGRRRTMSTCCVLSFGTRIRLAIVDVSLREPCPKRAQGGSQGRIAIGSPERDDVLGLAVGNAAQFDGWRRVGRHPFGFLQRRANVLGGDGLLVRREDEPCRGSSGREAGEIDDRGRHERAVRHDDLATVVGPQLRRAEGDLLDRAAVSGDLYRVPDAERPLDQDPHAGEEVLEDVLYREADEQTNDAERGEEPAEGVPGIDRDYRDDAEGE